MKYIIFLLLLLSSIIQGIAAEKIKGQVYNDTNKNGVQDPGEVGLQGVLISNGMDIVKTDSSGNFSLEKIGHLPIFVIKPSGYQISKSHDNQPSFYDNSFTQNDADLHFGLFEQKENKELQIALLGDTQPHNVDEINYIIRASTDDLKTRSYDFSLALGDVVSDNPILLPLVKEVIGVAGHTSYFIFGNHDLNWDSLSVHGLENWDKDWIKTVGPTYYGMSWGSTNVLSMNNINVKWDDTKNKYGYDYYIDEGQMTFIKNYLSYLNKNDLLIVASHARPDGIDNKEAFYALFKGFSNVLFVFGHHHKTENYMIGKEQGWPNENPAHCIDAGAICGGHWRGEEDMFWIPSATMVDGTPKGYVFLEINGTDYNLRYKASGMPDKKQMHLYSPDHLTYDVNFKPADPTPENSFYANIYLGGDSTKVEYRVDGGEWLVMEKTEEPDPYLKRHMIRQKLGIYPTEGARKLKRTFETMTTCGHLWKASCPPGLSFGVHELEVRFFDPYIQNASQKHSFIHLSPMLKAVNKLLDERYKGWVSKQ